MTRPFDKADRIINRTAVRISNELNRMVADLPEEFATQQAIEEIIVALADLHPWLVRLIMEDGDIRESYWAAVARRPVTPRRRARS
jgi:hypothetical protein